MYGDILYLTKTFDDIERKYTLRNELKLVENSKKNNINLWFKVTLFYEFSSPSRLMTSFKENFSDVEIQIQFT